MMKLKENYPHIRLIYWGGALLAGIGQTIIN